MKKIIVLTCLALMFSGFAQASSLVAMYEFENNLNDSNGIYNGTAYNGPTYTSGSVGSYAINFDGVDDYVQIARTVSNDFTIAFWVKTTQTGGSGQWWAGKGLVDGDTSSSSLDFGTSLVGSSFAFGIGGDDYTIKSTTAINDGQWHHVAAVRDQSSGLFSVYVNGVLENSAIGSTDTLNRSSYLRVGSAQTGGNNFSGAIDDVRIYDYVLGQSDIALLAGGDAEAPAPNPASWAIAPVAVSSEAVTMTAITGSDPAGIVEYYFDEISGNTGGNGSGWQSSSVYTDSGLEPMQSYKYVVRMKDKYGNISDDSAAVTVVTGPVADSDKNDYIDMADFENIAIGWLGLDCQSSLWCAGADLDIDGSVGVSDMALFADQWLEKNEIGHFYTWAPTPPMGWNSYDCYGNNVKEYQVRDNADFMAQYLKEYGWQYIVIDACWYVPDVGVTGMPNQNSSFEPHSCIDNYGRLIPDDGRFPSSMYDQGFKPLSDYIHSLGLKFGIHLMRGIPREVVDADLPIKGTNYTTGQIADTSSTCAWYNLMYGLNMEHPGAQAYLDSMFELYASWGLDFVKVDDLSRPYYSTEIEGYRKAIDKCGRKIVFSTSPGATTITQADHIVQNANMWRLTDDLWDSWSLVDQMFDKGVQWYTHCDTGHWPDMDMLPLGKLAKYGPVGVERYSYLTEDESYLMMTLWFITRSPLMFGGNMPENTAFVTSLMTNPEAIAVSQDSTGNRPVYVGTYPAWLADIPDSEDQKYLAVFNRSGTGPTSVDITLADLGIKRCIVRDLWSRSDLGEFTDTFSPEVNSHGGRLFKLTVLETAVIPPASMVLYNPGFDDQSLGEGVWSSAGNVSGWSYDSGGYSHAQNLGTSDIDPASQSGNNVCILNQGAWVGQNLTSSNGTPVLIEANKEYSVTVWVGRRLGTEGSAAGILSAYLEDVTTDTKLDELVYDLATLSQGQWVQLNMTFNTGSSPTGVGNQLRLGFMNTGISGSEFWYSQIVLDNISID